MPRHGLPMIYPDAWNEEFIGLETHLTIFQLLLLFSIDARTDSMGIFEPVWPIVSKEELPLKNAVLMDESTLLEAGQARTLERLGLIELNQQDSRWELTDKGIAAVRFWREGLQDHSADA